MCVFLLVSPSRGACQRQPVGASSGRARHASLRGSSRSAKLRLFDRLAKLGAMREAIVIIVLIAMALGAASALPNPTFSICEPRYKYPERFRSFEEIDFRNREIVVFGEGGHRLLAAKLQDGVFNARHSHSSDWVKLISATNFDDAGGRPRRALLRLDYVSTGASASDFGIVQIFELLDDHLVVSQQIMFNERGGGAESSFSAKNGILTIKGIHGWEHCCPTTLDVGTFQWNESRFKLMKTASIPIPSTGGSNAAPR